MKGGVIFVLLFVVVVVVCLLFVFVLFCDVRERGGGERGEREGEGVGK